MCPEDSELGERPEASKPRCTGVIVNAHRRVSNRGESRSDLHFYWVHLAAVTEGIKGASLIIDNPYYF